MTSSAQLSYPVTGSEDQEKEAGQSTEDLANEQQGQQEQGSQSEQVQDNGTEGAKPEEESRAHGVSGDDPAPFGIPAEDFCAEAYETQGHVETRQELGRKGEEAACRYLEAKGYEILERNWYCHFGEADIIARDPDGTFCFIEVKTRRSVEAGIPEEAITRDKRRRYERIALCYMMVCDDWDDNDPVRFDAIGICATGGHRALLRHHKSCFDASI